MGGRPLPVERDPLGRVAVRGQDPEALATSLPKMGSVWPSPSREIESGKLLSQRAGFDFERALKERNQSIVKVETITAADDGSDVRCWDFFYTRVAATWEAQRRRHGWLISHGWKYC